MTADYLFFVDKTELHWHIMISWMIYPALYVVFVYWRAWVTIVTHGTSHLYPYTFMDPRMNDVFPLRRVPESGIPVFPYRHLCLCSRERPLSPGYTAGCMDL